MKVLVACEFSGTVRDAFAALGHDAWSCDLLVTDREGQHHQGDVMKAMSKGGAFYGWDFDLLIAHPPCTFLTCAAEWAFSDKPMINGKPRKMNPDTLIGSARRAAREDALKFIDWLWALPIKKKCIENPRGVISKMRPELPKPQYVQPHWFGEDASKSTGLWLDNLEPLKKTNEVEGRKICCGENITELLCCPHCLGEKTPVQRWGNQTDSGQNREPPSADRWKIRSKTYQGIADAMAFHWG